MDHSLVIVRNTIWADLRCCKMDEDIFALLRQRVAALKRARLALCQYAAGSSLKLPLRSQTNYSLHDPRAQQD
jgi:hypothetical protein